MMRRSIVSVLVAAVGVAVLASCYSWRPSPGDPGEPVPLAEDAWPAPRAAVGLERLRDITPAELPRYLPPADIAGNDVPERYTSRRTVIATNTLTEHGLLRVWREEPSEAIDAARDRDGSSRHFARPIVAPNADFVTHSIFEALADREAARVHARLSAGAPLFETDHAFALIGGQSPVALRLASPTPEDVLLGAGHDIGFPSSVEPDVRGTIVYLPSTVPTRYERRLLEFLQGEGWAIVFVDSKPRVRAPSHAEYAAVLELRRLWLREQIGGVAERFGLAPPERSREAIAESASLFQRSRAEIPRPASGFTAGAGVGVRRSAADIADAVDTLLAEHALAAEAAIDHFLDEHARLSSKPVCVMGFSAGALAAPAVAARLRETQGGNALALVLVGGGGNVLRLATNSEFTDGGIRFDGPERSAVGAREVAALSEAYLEASALDPLHAIAAIRDVPLLHVYADDDTWVPTAGAEALNAAHSSPDRLVHDGGHTTLFYFLNSQRRRIGGWLDDRLPRPASSSR